MFKKTMTFDDLEGNPVTETFYFNFKKLEIAELIEFGAIQEYADPNKTYIPLDEMMKRLSTPVEESGLTQQENTKQAYNIFKNLILDAYGVKGENNVSFDKTAELRHYWSTHVAFDELIWEFVGNTALASQFIENCLPPRLVKEAKEEMQKENPKLSSESLAEMVEEANRRQQDPATRIEPGPEAAAAVLGENKEVARAAEAIAKDSRQEDRAEKKLSAADVNAMSDEEFAKLDVRGLEKDAMFAAFQRKSQS